MKKQTQRFIIPIVAGAVILIAILVLCLIKTTSSKKPIEVQTPTDEVAKIVVPPPR